MSDHASDRLMTNKQPPNLVVPRHIQVHTLGCKLNYAETSTVERNLRENGYKTSPLGGKADALVINTCSVTENAEKDCRQLIRRFKRANPEGVVAVTGCYAQLRPEEIASIDGVNAIFGSKEKYQLADFIESLDIDSAPSIFVSEMDDAPFEPSSSMDASRTRAYLKVQDGCNYNCSFCTIPLARGASRSATIEHVVSEAIRFSETGYGEIILSGVNIGDFNTNAARFYDLMLAIEHEPRITARIRISSIEPNLLSHEIIDLVAASQKFCPHFHVPLQSGSPTILKAMRRRYTAQDYESTIAYIKQRIPNAGIGVDVIVGFPGETDEDFNETHELIQRLDVSYLHVFTYSERPNTPAASMKAQVPVSIRRERNRALRILSEQKRRAFYASQVGREVDVLLENNTNSEGYSENYVRVSVSGTAAAPASLIKAKLDSVRGDVMTATSMSKSALSSFQLPILQTA